MLGCNRLLARTWTRCLNTFGNIVSIVCHRMYNFYKIDSSVALEWTGVTLIQYYAKIQHYFAICWPIHLFIVFLDIFLLGSQNDSITQYDCAILASYARSNPKGWNFLLTNKKCLQWRHWRLFTGEYSDFSIGQFFPRPISERVFFYKTAQT